MMKVRRDQVKPGWIVKSSHGYNILVVEVDDSAERRVDERHVGISGHIHANPERKIVSERYEARSMIEVVQTNVQVHTDSQSQLA